MATADLATLKAAAVVDARGSACPGPLMEAKKGHWPGEGRGGPGSTFQ